MLMKLPICLEIWLSSGFVSSVLFPGMTHPVPCYLKVCVGARAWRNSLSFEAVLYLISNLITGI